MKQNNNKKTLRVQIDTTSNFETRRISLKNYFKLVQPISELQTPRLHKVPTATHRWPVRRLSGVAEAHIWMDAR